MIHLNTMKLTSTDWSLSLSYLHIAELTIPSPRNRMHFNIRGPVRSHLGEGERAVRIGAKLCLATQIPKRTNLPLLLRASKTCFEPTALALSFGTSASDRMGGT